MAATQPHTGETRRERARREREKARGWIAIVVGGAEILAAWLVVQRQFAGQWLAGVLAGLSVLVHFLALGAYPVWSVIAIVTNGLVIWAITTHGDEFE